MVGPGGLEPPLLYRKRILSPQRLPIPPRAQTMKYFIVHTLDRCKGFFTLYSFFREKLVINSVQYHFHTTCEDD
jgi:hypothetical protein